MLSLFGAYHAQHCRGSFQNVLFILLISPLGYKPLRLISPPKNPLRSCISQGLITGILRHTIKSSSIQYLQGKTFVCSNCFKKDKGDQRPAPI